MRQQTRIQREARKLSIDAIRCATTPVAPSWARTDKDVAASATAAAARAGLIMGWFLGPKRKRPHARGKPAPIVEQTAALVVAALMKPRGAILNQPVVLVVEDEFLVRTVQVDILKDADFWVLEAENADEAFEILKQRPEVRVVLTDVDMPGSLDGFEFARLVAQGWPEVGVLVISGKTAPSPGDMPPTALFAGKPLRPAALVEKIQALLARAEPKQAQDQA